MVTVVGKNNNVCPVCGSPLVVKKAFGVEIVQCSNKDCDFKEEVVAGAVEEVNDDGTVVLEERA